MYKVCGFLMLCALLAGLTGCGASQRDQEIRHVIELISNVSSTYRTLKDDLNKASDKHEKDKKPLTEEDWRPLVVKAEDLKKIAQEVQAYKGHLDSFRDSTSDEQKRRFAESYGVDFRDRVLEVDREERAYHVAFNRAYDLSNDLGKEEADKLRKTVKDGKDVFDLLTKQR